MHVHSCSQAWAEVFLMPCVISCFTHDWELHPAHQNFLQIFASFQSCACLIAVFHSLRICLSELFERTSYTSSEEFLRYSVKVHGCWRMVEVAILAYASDTCQCTLPGN